MNKKVQVNLRLPKEVIEQVKAEAKRQKRSMNNLLEIMIDEYLNKNKDEKNG